MYYLENNQYLSMENVESLIANAGSVYGLNGYLLTLTNPVNMVYNGYTIETNTELAYEAPEQSAWQAFWGSTLGKAVAIGLVWLAAVVSMATGNIGGFLAAMGITVCSLALGGVISGCQSWRQGKGFWYGFDNYINCNWSQSFAITATLVVIDCGIRAVAAVISNAGSKAPIANAKNVADEPLQFTSREKLEEHFGKHAKEFGGLYQTPEEYLAGANYVVKNGMKVSYIYKGEPTTGYVKFYGNSTGNGQAKFAFVGTNSSGYITTYHIKKAKELWRMLGTNGGF
mgnify:CR=1 FL=1